MEERHRNGPAFLRASGAQAGSTVGDLSALHQVLAKQQGDSKKLAKKKKKKKLFRAVKVFSFDIFEQLYTYFYFLLFPSDVTK